MLQIGPLDACIAPSALVLLMLAPGCAPDEQARLSDGLYGEDAMLLERGEYLVEGLLQCFYCHSERDWDAPGAPVAGRPGVGRVYSDDGEWRTVAPNITPDRESGIGAWTDEELGRAIRQGISRDGRRLSSAMPYEDFRYLPDDELASVIAYLKAREPVRTSLPPTVLSPEERASLAADEPEPPQPMDLRSEDPVERGRAMARVARCQGCHTPWNAPINPGFFAGGNLTESGFDPARGGPEGIAAHSANLTPAASGVSYDARTFAIFMRTGRAGTLRGSMPWRAFANLTDGDLDAIHAFLQTLYPIEHWVSNVDEPTFCVVCGQIHGGGVRNRNPEPPESISLSDAELEAYAGDYYSEWYDYTLRLEVLDGHLVARHGEGYGHVEPAIELSAATLSATRIYIETWGVLDARFDDEGRIDQLIELSVDAAPVVRIQ